MLDRYTERPGETQDQFLLPFRTGCLPVVYHDDKVFQRPILTEHFELFDVLVEQVYNGSRENAGEPLNTYDPCELRACWVPEYLDQSYFKENKDSAIMF